MNEFNEIQQGILMSSEITPFQKIVYASVHIKDLFGGKVYNIPERLGIEFFDEMNSYVDTKELIHTGTDYHGESYFGYLIYNKLNPPNDQFLSEQTRLVFYNRNNDSYWCVINMYDVEISMHSSRPTEIKFKNIDPMPPLVEHNLKNIYKTINGREVRD